MDFGTLLVRGATHRWHIVDAESVWSRLENDECFEIRIGYGPACGWEIVLVMADGKLAVQRLGYFAYLA